MNMPPHVNPNCNMMPHHITIEQNLNLKEVTLISHEIMATKLTKTYPTRAAKTASRLEVRENLPKYFMKIRPRIDNKLTDLYHIKKNEQEIKSSSGIFFKIKITFPRL